MRHYEFARLAASAALIVPAIMAAVPATAQTAQQVAGDSERDLSERSVIIVTVKNTQSTILDYPGAVTAIDAAELDARNFQDLSTLTYAAPNVSLDTVGTFKGVANFSIRGLGINSSIPSIDPAVGLFIDGVYMGTNAGTVFDTLDLERVDILRGPQGVSFGRNTTGGAVMVQTADPSDAWEGYARIAYEGPVDSGRGTGMLSGRAVISGPISDAVSFRLGVLHSDDGGYFTNQFDGANYGASQTTVVRGGLKAQLSPNFTITAKGEWTDSSGDGSPSHNNGLFARDTFEISLDEPGFYRSENGLVTVRAQLDLGEGRLTNIFGWRSYDLATRNDIDSSPAPIFASDTTTKQDQWSNELTYTLDTGPLRLTSGLYYFHQDTAYDESRALAAPQFGGGKQDHDVLGVFGEVEGEVSEAFSLTAGLRWSREEKAARVTYVRPRSPCSVIASSCPIDGERVDGENNGFADTRSWDNFSPRLVATWRASEDARVYASWARGFRSGGYNFRITQPAAFEAVSDALGSPAFDSERVDTFELGAKWQSPGGAVYLQGALFWSEVDNLQRELILPSATAGFAQSIYNTADARIKGGELEASFRPASGLSLNANVGLTDAQYRRVFFDLSGDSVIDAADLSLELPRAPKWTFGGSVNYEIALSDSKFLRANVFFQHRDKYAYTDNNWGFNYASDRVDASLLVGCTDCGITLTVFGRNLLDEVQFGADAGLPFAGGPFSDGNNRPFDPAPAAGTFSPIGKGRVVGVELGAEF